MKPQNVLLDSSGQAKVIDFGIARSANEVRPGLTLTGTVLGSSDYISPEQAQGRTVEERTDVYSFAIVLYELLTGELPSRARTSSPSRCGTSTTSRRSRTDGGSSLMWRIATATKFSPVNGSSPVRSS